MSKALTKAQTDLDTLKAELEAWIASQPPMSPAAKRTRTQLVASATRVPVAVPVAVLAPPVVFVDATHITAIEVREPAYVPRRSNPPRTTTRRATATRHAPTAVVRGVF